MSKIRILACLVGNGGRARAAGPGGDPGRRGPVGAGPGDSVTAGGTGPDTDLGTEDRALAPGRCLSSGPLSFFHWKHESAKIVIHINTCLI